LNLRRFQSHTCFVPILASTALVACGADRSTGGDRPCDPGFVTEVVSVQYGAQAGFGQASMPQVVFGPPHGAGSKEGSLDVVSLGLDGSIVLGFDHGIADGPGADLIVFENVFFAGGDPDHPFVEPATVSVSDDLSSWTAWPCAPEIAPYDGCAGTHPVFSNPDNEISPFDVQAAGGDAFDLASIGISRARYLRIQSSSRVPGTSGTSGFDLDAVAVLHPDCR
jgi:hypothetical protein